MPNRKGDYLPTKGLSLPQELLPLALHLYLMQPTQRPIPLSLELLDLSTLAFL